MAGDAGTGIAIGEAGPEAAARFAKLHALCFAPLPETPWPEAAFRSVLRLPGICALVGRSPDGAVRALLVGRKTGGDAEVLTLCVAPDLRRSGVARRLLEAFVEDVGEDARISLEVAVDNRPALELYEAMGFVRAGRRPGYYAAAGRRADALILVRGGENA